VPVKFGGKALGLGVALHLKQRTDTYEADRCPLLADFVAKVVGAAAES
jgi:hypothetical protein